MNQALPVARWADRFRLVGTDLDRKFRVESVIAHGGYGIVYAAQHLSLATRVALKVLKVPDDYTAAERKDYIQRFEAEAQTIARIRHPNVVQVLDSGSSQMPNGEFAPWIVLEWLTGQTLKHAFLPMRGRRRLAPGEMWTILRPVVEALAFAHEEGIAHRDIKPDNIMLVRTRRGVDVKLLDFGVAKEMQHGEHAGSGRTATRGLTAGYSPPYASPEQVGATRSGPWTDVHGIGLVMTELLAGCAPYPGMTSVELVGQTLSADRPTPARHGVDVGAPLEAVIARAVALSPKRRYQSARELLDAVDRVVQVIPGADPLGIAGLGEESLASVAGATNISDDASEAPAPAPYAPAPDEWALEEKTDVEHQVAVPVAAPIRPAPAPAPAASHQEEWSQREQTGWITAGGRSPATPIGPAAPAAPRRPSRDEFADDEPTQVASKSEFKSTLNGPGSPAPRAPAFASPAPSPAPRAPAFASPPPSPAFASPAPSPSEMNAFAPAFAALGAPPPAPMDSPVDASPFFPPPANAPSPFPAQRPASGGRRAAPPQGPPPPPPASPPRNSMPPASPPRRSMPPAAHAVDPWAGLPPPPDQPAPDQIVGPNAETVQLRLSMAPPENLDAAVSAPVKGGSKRWLVVVGAAVLVLAGAGVAAYFTVLRSTPQVAARPNTVPVAMTLPASIPTTPTTLIPAPPTEPVAVAAAPSVPEAPPAVPVVAAPEPAAPATVAASAPAEPPPAAPVVAAPEPVAPPPVAPVAVAPAAPAPEPVAPPPAAPVAAVPTPVAPVAVAPVAAAPEPAAPPPPAPPPPAPPPPAPPPPAPPPPAPPPPAPPPPAPPPPVAVAPVAVAHPTPRPPSRPRPPRQTRGSVIFTPTGVPPRYTGFQR